MQKTTLVKYNNFEKSVSINWQLNVGDIVENCLKTCNLIIYNIKEVVLRNSATSQNYVLAKFSAPIDPEYITGNGSLTIEMVDGERNKDYIEAYNNYLQEKSDLELAKSLQNEFNGTVSLGRVLNSFLTHLDQDENGGVEIGLNSGIFNNDNPGSMDTLILALNLLNSIPNTNIVIDDSDSDSNSDSDEDDDDGEGEDNNGGGVAELPTFTPIHNLEAMGFIQDDVKITLTKEELDKQRRVLYEKYTKSKVYQKNNFKGTTCNICLEDFQNTDNIMILKKCNHYYHVDCIEKWLTDSSNKCPICKKTVSKGRANVKVD